MTIAIPATKARQQFFKLIDAANQPGAVITITIEGEPKIVMMPVEDFEGWRETLEIMQDPELMKGIKAGLKDIKKDKLYSPDKVKHMLKI